MTATIVVSNVLYLAAAVVAMVVISLGVVLRHREPKSIEAHMESFNRGLRALAPDGPPRERAVTARPARTAGGEPGEREADTG